MPFQPGDRVGPYEIVSVLGAGGMGEVYRAQDLRLGREVAIKVLPEQFASDPDRLRRFKQEARAIAALNHPHICQLYDIGPGYLVLSTWTADRSRDRCRQTRPYDSRSRSQVRLRPRTSEAFCTAISSPPTLS
jgi:hypothetical protein